MLIDGADALPAIAEAIAAGAASSCTSPAGTSQPAFELVRGRADRGARGAAGRGGRAASTCGCSSGPGSPVPLFHPTRERGAASARATSPARPGSRPRRDPREHPFHCHHEKTDRHRRRAGVRRRHRHDRLRAATASTLQRPPRPPAAGLARRRHPAARSGGGRRRRPLPTCAGASSPASSCRVAPAPEPAGEHDGAGRAHGRRGHVRRRSPTATSGSSRATCARCASRPGAHLPREPVPVVARDRRRARRQAAQPARPRTSASSSCSRPRPTTAHDDTRGQLGRLIDADDGARPAAGGDAPLASTGDRDDPLYVHAKVAIDRRPLADRRLGQPQRPLAVQRHRDERRHRRRRRWPATRACACGPSTSRWTRPRSRTRPRTRARRRALAPDRRRAARAPARRSARHATACSSCPGVAALRTAARSARRTVRRRLMPGTRRHGALIKFPTMPGCTRPAHGT